MEECCEISGNNTKSTQSFRISDKSMLRSSQKSTSNNMNFTNATLSLEFKNESQKDVDTTSSWNISDSSMERVNLNTMNMPVMMIQSEKYFEEQKLVGYLNIFVIYFCNRNLKI